MTGLFGPRPSPLPLKGWQFRGMLNKTHFERKIPLSKLNPKLLLALGLCVALGLLAKFALSPGQEVDGGTAVFSPTHTAVITIENYGTITVDLDGNIAPKTVENFVTLAESGFYDGLTFHRIKEGFVMQGGDPKANGTGGSGTKIVGEFNKNGVANPLSHTRGAISMARAKDFNSASSQFFIVHKDSTQLDGQYAVFGYVTEGMDVVDKICADAKPTDGNGTIPREAQPVITSIVIRK